MGGLDRAFDALVDQLDAIAWVPLFLGVLAHLAKMLARSRVSTRPGQLQRHPLLAEVEKLIPRPARQEFSLLMWSAWLEAKLVELPRAQAASAVTRRRFAAQWTARKQTLRALDMRATVDRDEFFRFQHGDGRTKLIERLAAAYRTGELPGYMLKFVDSLRTRAKSNTSQISRTFGVNEAADHDESSTARLREG